MFGSSNRRKKRSPLHFDEFDQPDEDGEQQQEQTASSSSSQQHLAGIQEEGDVLEEPSMPFQVLMKSKDGGQQRKSPTKNGRSKSVSILEMSSNGGNMMNGNTRYGKPATGGLMDSGEVSGSDLFSEDQYAALATNLTGSSDHVPNRTLSAPPTLERHHPPSNHMLVRYVPSLVLVGLCLPSFSLASSECVWRTCLTCGRFHLSTLFIRCTVRFVSVVTGCHSEKAGDSEVEQMAANYSFRHKSRLPVTLHVRKVFLIACKEKALQRQYGLRKILVEDLIDLKHAYAEEHKQHRSLCMNFPTRYLFISDEQEQMMTMYRRAVEVATTYQLYDEKGEEEFFYYEDFVFDYTRLEAKWPWFRPGLHQPLLGILFYYLITPIFFCDISRDESICHNVPSENSPGWLSAVYFASVTLSTVGYGTLTVTKNNDWNLLFGTIFMILSNVVLIVAYGSAVEQTFTKVKEFNERLINRILKETDDQDFMHKKVRRLRLAMLCQFTFQFIGVNLLGLAAVLIHLAIARSRGQEHEFADWSWMKCLYWAVQTTTTIGKRWIDGSIPIGRGTYAGPPGKVASCTLYAYATVSTL